VALVHGLAGKALEILLASDVSVFGAEGAQTQLDLMLSTGRVHDVRTLLEEDLKGLLGPSRYHWLRVLMAAALGDYAEADRELQAMQQAAGAVPRGGKGPAPALTDLGLVVGGMLLDGTAEDKSAIDRIRIPLARANAMQRLAMLLQAFRSSADVGVLRGVLALERGETAQAEGHFREALALWGEPGRRAPTGMDFSLRPVAEDCLALIRRSARPGR
jgi:hypothetical protein